MITHQTQIIALVSHKCMECALLESLHCMYGDKLHAHVKYGKH